MKVYLKTFGCRANQYDTETVRAMVERAGGEVVNAPDEADVAVFNSCAVTAEAEVDLRKAVRRAARRRPTMKSVVMGCASARDTGALGQLPTVVDVVPGADYVRIAAALNLPPSALGAATQQAGTRGLLRVQDGCDEHCTFCATTLARGANRSRAADELVREAHALATVHNEIVLTGIHIGTYGQDSGSSLGALMQRLMHEVPAVRFRLSSIEATEVDEALRECFAHPRQLVPHIHAPLQSGSDRILKVMGRHWYTAAGYERELRQALGSRTIFGVGADVIAGFPGETDADHAATLALVERLPFSYLHVFPFSARPGTAAAKLPGHHPPEVVAARARALREAGARKAAQYSRRRVGTKADVVVVRGERREGLSEDYLSVTLEGADHVGRGERLAVTIDEGAGGALIGRLSPSVPA